MQIDYNLTIRIFNFFNQNLWLLSLFKFISVYLLPIIGVIIFGLIARREIKTASILTLKIAVIWLIGELISSLSQRLRPYLSLEQYIWPQISRYPQDYSFPSIHTLIAFSLATLAAEYFKNRYLSLTLFILAGLIGISRIAVGVHFLSDVIAGALIGYLGAMWWNKQYDNVRSQKSKVKIESKK